jgi:hypothetical protein
VPSADRLTIASATGGPLAKNVASVRFTFLNVENGYSGYSEIQIFGVRTVSVKIAAATISGGNLILTGSGGTPGNTYSWLTSTNAASPVATWTVSTTGAFDSNGVFSNSIPVVPSEPGRFFKLRTP